MIYAFLSWIGFVIFIATWILTYFVEKICDLVLHFINVLRAKEQHENLILRLQRNAAVSEVERLRTLLGTPPSRSEDPWRS